MGERQTALLSIPDAVDRHLRAAEEADAEDRRAHAPADVHARVALLVPPGFVRAGVERRVEGADEGKPDLPAVGMAGEDEVDALSGGRGKDDGVVAEGDPEPA